MGALTIAFGPFRLDDQRRLLLCGDAPVHLSLKAYELLKLLLTERPRVVPKNELHQRLWPDTFVSDSTLASLVAELRAALGETGSRSGLLRTVHGFGYAFAAEAVGENETRAPAGPLIGGAPSCVLLLGDRQFELGEGENVIGREDDARVRVASLSVSRHHARIVVSSAGATIEDMGSKNGTNVQGTRLAAPATLHDGDAIQVGTLTFTFRIVTAGASTLTST